MHCTCFLRTLKYVTYPSSLLRRDGRNVEGLSEGVVKGVVRANQLPVLHNCKTYVHACTCKFVHTQFIKNPSPCKNNNYCHRLGLLSEWKIHVHVHMLCSVIAWKARTYFARKFCTCIYARAACMGTTWGVWSVDLYLSSS